MATVRLAGYDMTLSLVWMTSSKLSARADPEAGTDHILKPHDFDALQCSWTLQSCHHRRHGLP